MLYIIRVARQWNIELRDIRDRVISITTQVYYYRNIKRMAVNQAHQRAVNRREVRHVDI